MREKALTLFVLIIILKVFTFCMASEGSHTQTNSPLTITQLYLNDGGRAIPFSRAMYDTTLFIPEFSCRLDSVKVDLVFVVDTTGSMSDDIANVRAAMDGLSARLDALGYDVKFGLVTFGDTFFIHDYDTMAGYQMTDRYIVIRYSIFCLTSYGEPTSNEWVWTALWHALSDYQWRKDALRIVFLATDEPSCALDVSGCATDSCGVYAIDSLHPYPQYANPKMKAIDEGFIIYTMTPSTLYFGGGSCSTAFWDTMYHQVASATGGINFPKTASWTTVWDSIRPMVDSARVLTVCFTNNSSDTIDTTRIEIEPGDSMSILLGDTIRYFYSWPPGSTLCFAWRLHITSYDTIEGNCFALITRLKTGSSTEIDTTHGCLVPCGLSYIDTCQGPYTINICPPDTSPTTTLFSACPDQEIVVSIADSDTTIDSTSIRFRVTSLHGTFTYTIDSSQLSWDPPYLTFTPDTEWGNNTTITYKVTNVKDAKGCHSNVITEEGSFTIDLQPPVITSANPADGHIFTTNAFTAHYNFTDLLSGVRTDSSLYVVIEDTLTLYTSSPYITLGPGARITISGLWTNFCSDETMNVCIHLADNVPEHIVMDDDTCDMCGPNDTTYCYQYINTSLKVLSERKFEESILVYPNPFNDALTIELSGIPQPQPIVEIYDLNGKLVAKPSQIEIKDAKHLLKWKPDNIPSGVYILKAQFREKLVKQFIIYIK